MKILIRTYNFNAGWFPVPHANFNKFFGHTANFAFGEPPIIYETFADKLVVHSERYSYGLTFSVSGTPFQFL